jgi:hypothetical protein
MIEDHTETRLDLWSTLRDYIVSAFYIMGSPLVLAELGWVRMEKYIGSRNWLFRCEELFRRLLFVDALELGREQLASTSRHRAARRMRPAPPAFNIEHPESWRVSFNLLSGKPSATRATYKRKPPVNWNTTACVYPIARRLEALVRAFNAPDRHVRRMARLIARQRAAIAARFARPTRTYMTTKATGGDLACAEAADFVARVFADSS